jgi:hypothetical protein
MKRILLAGAVAAATATLGAQAPQFSDDVRAFISVDAPVVALTNARVIDGTGAPARANQTLIIRNGAIDQVGDASEVHAPEGAKVIDLTGKSVMPGIVMLHEHLYYPTGPGVYGQLGESFTRLYLAGGVTTMRTAGNVNGFMDLKLKTLIDEGKQPGPAIDSTAPYLNGPSTFLQMRDLKDADDARRQVAYWADMGATSFKAYMAITRDELRAAVDEAHKRGLKVTGHLCSVTYAEAADIGIDDLEHGFMAATDFVPDKQPDVCPGQGVGQRTIASLDENGEPFKALVKKLVDRHVALTSTLTVFETFTPRPPDAARPGRLAARAQGPLRSAVLADRPEPAVALQDAVFEGHGPRARVRARRRPPRRRYRSDRRRGRDSRLLQPAPDRAAGRGGLHAARGDSHCHAERRDVPWTRVADWSDRTRQAGGPRRHRRRSVGNHCGRSKGGDRLQAGRRV